MATYDLDEQERLDELKAWWKRWGNLVMIGLAVVIAAAAGWRYWQNRFAALRPSAAQRREQQQVGFVLSQHDTAPRKSPDLPANAAFFSRAPGPGPDRSVAASTGNSAGTVPGGECPRTP